MRPGTRVTCEGLRGDGAESKQRSFDWGVRMDMTLLIEVIAIAAIMGILAIAMKAKNEDTADAPPADSPPQSTT